MVVMDAQQGKGACYDVQIYCWHTCFSRVSSGPGSVNIAGQVVNSTLMACRLPIWYDGDRDANSFLNS
jgi:hypothetical protein